jgi:scavenger receptor class B, member 1
MDIYLFNWTNPDDIKNKSTKPNFQQLGPYRFREFPDKNNITFDENDFIINYRKLSSYFFDAEASNGSLSDLCTTVNLVALGAGNYAHNLGFWKQKIVSGTLSSFSQKIHVTKSIQELLYDGYEDAMMKMSSVFSNDTPFDKVGYLVKRNATDVLSGNYGVHTGVETISKLGSIANYNNLTEFPFYEGECKKLKGSPGEFFPPKPSITKPIHLFAPEMCRSIPYEYEKDIELHGLKGHRFLAGLRALDNGTLYDENKCFATEESMPSGVMNVSICNYGHPMFMSFPHFHGADSSYVDAVDGLEPQKEKHQTYITLEPVSDQLKVQNKNFLKMDENRSSFCNFLHFCKKKIIISNLNLSDNGNNP